MLTTREVQALVQMCQEKIDGAKHQADSRHDEMISSGRVNPMDAAYLAAITRMEFWSGILEKEFSGRIGLVNGNPLFRVKPIASLFEGVPEADRNDALDSFIPCHECGCMADSIGYESQDPSCSPPLFLCSRCLDGRAR